MREKMLEVAQRLRSLSGSKLSQARCRNADAKGQAEAIELGLQAHMLVEIASVFESVLGASAPGEPETYRDLVGDEALTDVVSDEGEMITGDGSGEALAEIEMGAGVPLLRTSLPDHAEARFAGVRVLEVSTMIDYLIMYGEPDMSTAERAVFRGSMRRIREKLLRECRPDHDPIVPRG